jgi:hypothetical protein
LADRKSATRQFLQLTITLVTTAFGLIAALAWNEAITTLVKAYIPGEGSNILSLFIYAVIVTVLAVIVLLQLSNLATRMGLEEKAAR